jgi:hypothetical protein
MPEAMLSEGVVLARLGAVLEAPLPGAEERIEARTFGHPALGARAIVKLGTEALREADVLAMGVLGCVVRGEPRVVGASTRRAVGFPAAVILADPDNARHALDVMRDLEAAARKARSKPGHAKDAIDAIGKKLGRTVPHFLPAFYEEAARRFAALGQQTQAATCFGKAREAERAHGLDVDPSARRESFLELALSGALTSAVLTAYAKDLEESADAAAAHDELLTLAVRAISGGMPPWASLSRDLRRLARRAGRDPDAQDARLWREVLGAPALAHANHAFWDEARAALVALAREDAAVRVALAAIWPKAQHKNDAYAWWIRLLLECGVIDELEAREAPIAPWLEKLVAHVEVGWWGISAPDVLFDLVRRLAPRLVRDAVPIAMVSPRGHWLDPDLLDLFVSLGVPLAPLPPKRRIAFGNWGTYAKGPERPRTIESLASDPRFEALLDVCVEEAMGQAAFDALVDTRPALCAVRDRIVRRRLADLERGGLPALETTRGWLEQKTRPATFASLPEERARLASLDLAALLATTLRGGLVDELGWPALDAAVAELHREDGEWPSLAGAFPHPIVVGKKRTFVLGVGGRVKEIAIELPGNLRAAFYSCGEVVFIVTDRKNQWSVSYLWSSERAARDLGGWYRSAGEVIELGDVTLLGGRLLAPPTKPHPESWEHCSDGTTVWALQWERDGQFNKRVWWEVDPRTGTKGRKSMPRFFEEFVSADTVLEPSALLPAAGLERSPLGVRDGRVGVRVRSRSGRFESERVDGVRVEGRRAPRAILVMPGDATPRAVVVGALHAGHYHQGDDRDLSLIVLDADGREVSRLGTSQDARPYTRGTERPMPLSWLHFGSVRDERGSRFLREIPRDRAASLLDRLGEEESIDVVVGLVAELLPEVTSDVVRRAIAGVAMRARHLKKALAEVQGAAPDGRPSVAVNPLLLSHLLLLCGEQGHPHQQKVAEEIAETGAVVADFLGGKSVETGARKGGGLGWEAALGSLEAVVLQTSLPAWGDTYRATARGFVELLASAGWLSIEHARLSKGTVIPEKLPKPVVHSTWAVFTHGDSLYLLRKGWHDATVLEVSRTGAFHAPQWFDVARTVTVPRRDPDAVRALAAGVATRGAWKLDAKHAAIVTARTGMTTAEASAWLVGISWLGTFPAELRAAFGLKVKEAERATHALVGRRASLSAVLAAVAAAGPAEDVEVFVARFAEQLAVELGTSVVVDEDLARELTADLGKLVSQPAASTLRWILAGARSPELSKRPGSFLDHQARAAEVAFNAPTVRHLAIYLAHLALELPAGHTALGPLADAYRAAREMLEDPTLSLPLCTQYPGYEPGQSPAERTAAMLDKLGGEPFTRGTLRGRDLGSYLVASLRDGWNLDYELRPARIDENVALLRALSQPPFGVLGPVLFLRSAACAAIVARMLDASRPSGSYDANLAVSAPGVVASIATTHALSPDAALLYAESLAHACPTDAKLRLWNGWSAKQLERARTELTQKQLVTIGKRERSGRSHFLPGPWETLRAPLKPMESFKLPFFASKTTTGWLFDLGAQLPLEPLAVHAAKVWEHAQREPPRLEEIDR